MRGVLVLVAGAGLALFGLILAPKEAPPGSAGETQPGRSLIASLSELVPSGEDEADADAGDETQAPASARRSTQSSSALQTYWQYIENGKVRFVSDLDDVPEQWRSRAGKVQMSGPPPGSPAEAREARAARTRHIRAPRTVASVSRHGGAAVEPNPNRWPEVTIYTTKSCGYCRKAIAHLERKGVPYTNKDVGEDSRAEKEYLRKGKGRRGVPLIDVGGEIIRGYSPASLDAALEAGS